MAQVSHARAAAYGAGSIAAASFVVTPQLLLLFFLTETLAVPPAWAGLAVLLPKAWEFIFDPTVGLLSDRARMRNGRRWPFLLAGACLFPPTFALLFAPPVLDDWRLTLAWVTVSFLLCTSAYSIFAIPFVTLPGEVSDDPGVRTRVVAWRMAFVGVGVLTAGGLAPLLVETSGGGREGFAHMGLAVAVLGGLMMLSAGLAARGFRQVKPEPAAQTRHPLRHLLGNRPYRWLWISYVVQMVSIAVSAALLPYAVQHVMKAPGSMVSVLFVAMTTGSILTMPIWVRIRARLGAMRAYLLASVVCAAGSAALFSVVTGNGLVASLAALAFGIGQAGQQLLPLSLLPSATEADDRVAGARHAGLFAGIWVAGEKLGMALGGALAALMLGLVGYVEGGVAQAANAVAAIPWLFAIIPGMILLASVLPLRHLRTITPDLGD
jgi:Na+/melibiose symporter-like transporter